MREGYALMQHGCIYTLKPFRPPDGTKTPFRWQGFCDGYHCGLFRTKKEFQTFVDLEPAPAPLGPHAEATFRAESTSTLEGRLALQSLADQAARGRAEKGGSADAR